MFSRKSMDFRVHSFIPYIESSESLRDVEDLGTTPRNCQGFKGQLLSLVARQLSNYKIHADQQVREVPLGHL